MAVREGVAQEHPEGDARDAERTVRAGEVADLGEGGAHVAFGRSLLFDAGELGAREGEEGDVLFADGGEPPQEAVMRPERAGQEHEVRGAQLEGEAFEFDAGVAPGQLSGAAELPGVEGDVQDAPRASVHDEQARVATRGWIGFKHRARSE